MMAFNMPPGCSPSDIPGNRPEDLKWEGVHDVIDQDCGERQISPEDAFIAWKIGVAGILAAREAGACVEIRES